MLTTTEFWFSLSFSPTEAAHRKTPLQLFRCLLWLQIRLMNISLCTPETFLGNSRRVVFLSVCLMAVSKVKKHCDQTCICEFFYGKWKMCSPYNLSFFFTGHIYFHWHQHLISTIPNLCQCDASADHSNNHKPDVLWCVGAARAWSSTWGDPGSLRKNLSGPCLCRFPKSAGQGLPM